MSIEQTKCSETGLVTVNAQGETASFSFEIYDAENVEVYGSYIYNIKNNEAELVSIEEWFADLLCSEDTGGYENEVIRRKICDSYDDYKTDTKCVFHWFIEKLVKEHIEKELERIP